MGDWRVGKSEEPWPSEAILQERILSLLQFWASEQRLGRHCGQWLYFVPLPEGTTAPGAFRVQEHWVIADNSEGENHAGHCPGSAKKRSPEQQSLLEATAHNGFDPA